MSPPTPLWKTLKKAPLPSWMIPKNSPSVLTTILLPWPLAPRIPQTQPATNKSTHSNSPQWPGNTYGACNNQIQRVAEDKKKEETEKPTTIKTLKSRRKHQILKLLSMTDIKQAKQKSLLITKLPPEVLLLVHDFLGPASQRLLASTCQPLYELHKQHYHPNIIHTSNRVASFEVNVKHTYHDVIVVSFEHDIEATGYTPEFMAIVSKWLGLEKREGRVRFFKWLRGWRKEQQEKARKEGRKHEVRCFPTMGKSFFEY
ncbi:uncharacterized protein PAC_02076 [Phialocephala subalpina]|uniref:F-box domain-containing protein n=1 Tax=Phialocephala subalpina TaxID=576137 RepID=A0A1L7WHF4_9HELO|nr:uncharacterized protein PAC_02076 [Phialocephala subalpina]